MHVYLKSQFSDRRGTTPSLDGKRVYDDSSSKSVNFFWENSPEILPGRKSVWYFDGKKQPHGNLLATTQNLGYFAYFPKKNST